MLYLTSLRFSSLLSFLLLFCGVGKIARKMCVCIFEEGKSSMQKEEKKFLSCNFKQNEGEIPGLWRFNIISIKSDARGNGENVKFEHVLGVI
jgi:hypothetical protein